MPASTVIFLVFGSALALYLIVSLLIWLYLDRLVFYPTAPTSFTPQRWSAYRTTLVQPLALLDGWILPGSCPDGPLVVYLGGNAESIEVNLNAFTRLGGSSVAVFSYRGYGASSGTPTCSSVTADAAAIIRHLAVTCKRPTTDIVLIGRSLGAAVAIASASQIPVGGLILITPFPSLRAMVHRLAPWFPSHLVRQLNSLATTARPMPEALFLIADDDAIVPPDLSLQLYHAWPTAKHLQRIPCGGHNGLQTDVRFHAAIDLFLERIAAAKSG